MNEPRPRVWSIRRRLLAALLGTTLGLGALALFDTRREAMETANELSDRILAGSAMVIAERAALDSDGLLTIAIPYGALEMLSSAAQDRVFYRIDSHGQLVTGYGDLPLARTNAGAGPHFSDGTYRGSKVRIATIARAVSTGIDEVPFTVTMAETTLAREALAQEILLTSALRLLGMILGAAAILWVAVTLALRPLARLQEAINQRSPHDLRAITTPVPSEVKAPVEALNSLMERLDQALAGLRNFTGNASHQLRTPMTVLRTELALAARAAALDEAKAASARADRAAARAERVLAQLLALARVDAAQGWAAQRLGEQGLVEEAAVDLAPLLRDLVAEHIPQAAEAGVDLGFDLRPEYGPHLAAIEPLLLGEALHNLISNAILYAGKGAMATLRLYGSTDQIVIELEDDGPGLTQPELALRRFSRQSAPSVEGMGLGLPIVQEIVTLFGGELQLAQGAGQKGLRVTLTLPRAR